VCINNTSSVLAKTSLEISLAAFLGTEFGVTHRPVPFQQLCDSRAELVDALLQGQWKTYCKTLSLLAFQSFGVVYGDLSTSPLYVYRSALSGRLDSYRDEVTIFGLFSLIFWTLTLIPLLKYVLIVLSADDNGEGE
jgi:hypothetical protein